MFVVVNVKDILKWGKLMVKNKLLLIFIIGMFCLSLVSALEFDNVKSYDEENEIITITNALGLGETIIRMQLMTDKDFKVIDRGEGIEQMVAMIKIHEFQDAYTGEEFENIKTYYNDKDSKEIERDITLKYRVTTLEYDFPIYKKVNCSIQEISGGEIEVCDREIIGYEKKENYDWIEFNSLNELPKKNILIGLFTDIQKGENVEWIPNTWFGKVIDEWAVWTEGMNVGLLSYWTMNETAGVMVDGMGNVDGVVGAGATRGVAGILNNSISMGTQDNQGWINITTTNELYNTSDFTISYWAVIDDWSSEHTFMEKRSIGVINVERPFSFYSFGGQVYFDVTSQAGVEKHIGTASITAGDGNWHNFIITYNGSTTGDMRVYLNGSLNYFAQDGFGVPTNLKNQGVKDWYIGYSSIGADRGMAGDVDEVGFWNRTLTASEIADLSSRPPPEFYSFVDSSPSVILSIPLNNSQFTTSSITFGCNSTDDIRLNNVTLYINGIVNETFATSSKSLNITTTKTFADGNYNWTCKTSDNATITQSTWASNNWTFNVDTIKPIFDVEYPTENLIYENVGQLIPLNVTINDSNLDTCWYDYNTTNTSFPCVSGIKSLSNFTLEANNSNMTIYANDTIGNLNSTFISWDYLIESFNLNYKPNITEGELTTISAEVILTEGSLISSAIIIYNNTNYLATINYAGGEYNISTIVTSPLVSSEMVINFSFLLTIEGITYTPTLNNQTVLNLNFGICGGISNDTLLNMTLVDEITLKNITGAIEISSDIISKTSGELVSSINGGVNNSNSYAICFSPTSSYDLYYLNSEIRYYADGYSPELYVIQRADMGDYPVNLTLYDLNSTKSTKFLIKYQDDNLITVEGAVIQLLKKYIAENIYRIVEAPITSNIGTAVVHIDLDSNLYQAVVVKDGVILDTFTNLVFNCESELSGICTQNLFGLVNSQNSVSIDNLEDFSYSISSVNNTITTIFSVPSGTPASINILLEQVDMFGNSTLCNQTVYSSAGSIDCSFNDTIGDSMVYLDITKNNKLEVEQSYYIKESGAIDWLGNNFFIVLIFLLSIVGMAVSSPEWIVVNGIMVMIISGGIWLLNGLNFIVGLGGLLWLLIGGVILIYKLSLQEDR